MTQLQPCFLETLPVDHFARCARLAERLFAVPIARVDLNEPARRLAATCADGVYVVEDAAHCELPGDQGDADVRFYAAVPVTDAGGDALGVLCIMDHEPRAFGPKERAMLQDIADIVTTELRSQQLAVTDELTQLSNRRGFELLARQALAMCERVGKPATVAMIDLEGFARFNEAHGRAAGDAALQAFANLLRSQLRTSDVVARIGGDEFAALLTGTDPRAAEAALARLRLELADTHLAAIGFSAGVIAYDGDRHATVFDALADADAAMLRARSGA